MNIFVASTHSSSVSGRARVTNFAAQAEQLRHYADTYAVSVGVLGTPDYPRFPASFNRPTSVWSPGSFPSSEIKTGGFAAWNAMSDEERSQYLQDREDRNRAADERRDSIMAERQQIFDQQQSAFQTRWQTYQQTLSNSLNPPVEAEPPPSPDASLSSIL